jgi:O-antigen/teichoic acid export membrane protein
LKTIILRLGGFAGFPLLGILTPLLLLPVIARVAGPTGWASIVSAIAIGSFGATAILWGWNIRGTVLVASTASAHRRAELYGQSLAVRALLAVIVLPIVVLLTALVAAPELRWDAAAVAAATAASGFSPAWFCVGIGAPRLMGIFDTLPRVISAVASIPLVATTGIITYYPALLLLLSGVSLVLFQKSYFQDGTKIRPVMSAVLQESRRQLGSAGVNVSGSAYSSVPVPIATFRGSEASASVYSSADQLYRFGLFTTVALGNTFQGWTLEVTGRDQVRRHAAAFVSHLILGSVGAVFLTSLGPFASSILFGAEVAATPMTCFLYGIAFLFINLGTPLIRNLLIPAGKDIFVLLATVASAVVGITLMVVLSASDSLVGIALGVAASEAVLFVIIAPAALRAVRSVRDEGTPEEGEK